MNTRNRYLTAVLLVLLGIMLGGVFVLMQQGKILTDRSDVQFTEIETSNTPLISDEDLEKLDARFLFKNVADRVIPTVVYISTVVTMDEGNAELEEGEDGNFWNRLRPRRARAVGSGVIVSENGYIVTNNHVIDGAVNDGISVALNDKRLYKARVVGQDPSTDIAIIKIDAANLPAITIGNSNEVDVGEWVLAVGNPFQLRSTVTAGIVSALSRQVQLGRNTNSRSNIASFIQTDAAINKGNSGGALVNTGGELIGINTAIATKSGSYQGYGFAVPSNLVRKVMSDLIEYGEVRRALLGVNISSVDFSRARQLGLNSVRGVEIRGLTDGGAAQQHGLQPNDIVLAVNGNEVNESNELQEKIAVQSPGDTVQLTIWRNGEIMDKPVELGRLESSDIASAGPQTNPDSNGQRGESEREVAFGSFVVGIKVMAISQPGEPELFDLIISEITPASEAHQQGLQEGYIIKKVNGTGVDSLEELKKIFNTALKDNNALLIEIETPGGAKGFYQLKQ